MISSCSLHQLLQWGRDTLKHTGISRGWVDARLLLAHALNCTAENLIISDDQEVTSHKVLLYKQYIRRRQQHEPVSRILKSREFWSLPFDISPATLDPRSETELIIETILKNYQDHQQKLKILDLGTGSGCILLSLLQEYPYAEGLGVDISLNALKVAQKNSEKFGLQDRVSWQQGSWTQGLQGCFDVIVSNPPYIPLKQILTLADDVKLYDPLKALDGGENGLECYAQIADQLTPFCHLKTQIYFEIGQGQEDDVTSIMRKAGFDLLTWNFDLSGIIRCGIFKISS
ncbi:MAG: peptide chain release factor N(5)-glutamine methyltransferase [Janthinobacterium lividum]